MTHTHTGGNMSDNKTGYEIRADLLSMAQGMLYENLQRKIDGVHTHNENHPDDKKPLPTQSITPVSYTHLTLPTNREV